MELIGKKIRSHSRLKFYDKGFQIFISQQPLARTLPHLEHNHIIPLYLITKHNIPGSGLGVGLMDKKLGHTNFKVV